MHRQPLVWLGTHALDIGALTPVFYCFREREAVVLLVWMAMLFAIPAVNQAVIGPFWFLLKISYLLCLMIWFHGTFPRYRYHQLMNIGWKIMIPLGMAAVLINAVLGMTRG